MADVKPIKRALISVFDKKGLEEIARGLNSRGVELVSTGGTHKFIESLGIKCTQVEDITTYPSILGGRVKTLHPKIFGGILARRDNPDDASDMLHYDIDEIDLVIVDLYPFEDTVRNPQATPEDIIEKIDIGGISLIRATAKNFADTVIIPSKDYYGYLLEILGREGASTTLEERRYLAQAAFAVSSGYDTAIFNYFLTSTTQDAPTVDAFRLAVDGKKSLRYGENPHQKAAFYGHFNEYFDQLHGKEISYNNLLDIDAAVSLMREFQNESSTVAILKHNNACGLATRESVAEAWTAALAGDPVSAFGGIIISNKEITPDAALEINKIFFEVIIAPSYSDEALQTLKEKKNRIILVQKKQIQTAETVRTALCGVLVQEKDLKQETESDLTLVSGPDPDEATIEDMFFANKIVKHSKSNAIVLAKNKQLLASGVGQTSRVDALKQAIAKAQSFGFDLEGATMASDAFFPFADCVEIAHKAGIMNVIQPGGSIRDKESIDYCEKENMTMVLTGFRHFKH